MTPSKNRSLLPTYPFALFTLLIPPSAGAHPGHSAMGHGMQHLLTSPYHLAVLAGIGAVLFSLAMLARTRFAKTVLRFGGITLTALAVLVWALN